MVKEKGHGMEKINIARGVINLALIVTIAAMIYLRAIADGTFDIDTAEHGAAYGYFPQCIHRLASSPLYSLTPSC